MLILETNKRLPVFLTFDLVDITHYKCPKAALVVSLLVVIMYLVVAIVAALGEDAPSSMQFRNSNE